MAKDTQIKTHDLPEKVRLMLSRVHPLVGLHHDCVITHYREDAVFIMMPDTGIMIYTLTRLVVNNPDIYFELQARAPRYLELRCFCSDWLLQNEAALRLTYVQQPYPTQEFTGSLRVRNAD